MKYWNNMTLTSQELSYVKHYLRKHMRLAIAFLTILALFLSGVLVPDIIIRSALSLFGGYVSGKLMDTSMYFISICIMAYVLPMFQFHFLMKRSSSDLYLSLPIKRERLFYIHYLIGLLFLICTALVTCGIGSLILLVETSDFPAGILLLAECLIYVLLGCCLYTFFTFLMMRCHTMLDSLVVCMAYTILPICVCYSLTFFLNHVMSEILVSISGIDMNLENQITLLVSLFSIPWQMNSWVSQFDQMIFGYGSCILCIELIFWLFASVFFYNNAKRSFIRIKSEESAQPAKWFFTYPFLIPFIFFLIILGLGKGKLISTGTIIGFICYMIAQFFARRRIVSDLRIPAIYICIVLFSSLCYYVGIQTSLFGFVYEIPPKDAISLIEMETWIKDNEEEDAYVYHLKDIVLTSNQLEDILSGYEEMISFAKNDWQDSDEEMSGNVILNYQLKNGNHLQRNYIFYEADKEQLLQLLDEWVAKGYAVKEEY